MKLYTHTRLVGAIAVIGIVLLGGCLSKSLQHNDMNGEVYLGTTVFEV